jgi:hypothetical protein
LRLEAWNLSTGLFKQLACLTGFQRSAAPSRQQPLAEIEGLLLESEAAFGNKQLRPRAAGIGVGAGGLCRDRDAGQVVRRLHRAKIGAAGLDRAADAAEQVELVADVQSAVEDLAAGCAARGAQVRLPLVDALALTPPLGSRSLRVSRKAARARRRLASATRRSVLRTSASPTSRSSRGSLNSRHQAPSGCSPLNSGERADAKGACAGAVGAGER